MSEELVERVSRAIYEAMGGEGVLEDDGTIRQIDFADSPITARTARKLAIAAIAAVRAHDAETGPSEAEIQASFHERGTFFRGEVRGILRAAAVERARGEVG